MMGRGVAGAVLAASVVVGALLQALGAVPGYGPIDVGLRLVLAAGSFVVLVAQLAAMTTATAVLAGVASPRRRAVLAWSGAVALVGVVLALVLPPALLVLVVAAGWLLPAAARAPQAGRAMLRVFRLHPWGTSAATLVTLLAAIVTWVVALLTGFFLTGFLGALALWLWLGVVGAALLLWWSHLRRPRR